jgi:hypothetical protein
MLFERRGCRTHGKDGEAFRNMQKGAGDREKTDRRQKRVIYLTAFVDQNHFDFQLSFWSDSRPSYVALALSAEQNMRLLQLSFWNWAVMYIADYVLQAKVRTSILSATVLRRRRRCSHIDASCSFEKTKGVVCTASQERGRSREVYITVGVIGQEHLFGLGCFEAEAAGAHGLETTIFREEQDI